MVGARNVVYQAASDMDHQGRIVGGIWNYARQYLIQMSLPWLDMLSVPQIDQYAKGTELVGKSKEIKKFLENYQALKKMTTVETSGLRTVGPHFSILGGTANMIFGGYEIYSNLREDAPLLEHEQTVKFYEGTGDLLSGLGTVTGGIATVMAGTTAAPVLAAAGTILFATGILLAAIAYGMKYSTWFRESFLGRRLTRFKKQLAGWFLR